MPVSRTRTPSPTSTLRVNCGPSSIQRLSTTSFASTSSYHPFSCPHLDFAVEKSFYRRYIAGADKIDRTYVTNAGRVHRARSNCTSAGCDDVFADDGTIKTDGYVRFSGSQTTVAAASTGIDSVLPSASDESPTPHNYEYPAMVPACSMSSVVSSRHRQSSVTPTIVEQVVLPRRKDKKRSRRRNHSKSAIPSVSSAARARCIYCQEVYIIAENGRGSCPDAPDDCAACIERASCLCAARALLYHCATDEDGSYGSVCGVPDSSPRSVSRTAASHSEHRHRRRKWVLLCFLSVILPCLWCYPALAACHSCSVRRGHCGARHRPV